MVVQVDYDKKKFDADGYGNLYSKIQIIIKKIHQHKTPKKYHGFTIDVCVGHVKVWDTSDNFFGEYPDVKTAKHAIKDAVKSNKQA